MDRIIALRRFAAPVLLVALTGCLAPRPQAPPRRPVDVRAQIAQLMPAQVGDREGWAADIEAALRTQDIEPTAANVCAVLAVAEQESTFRTDPPVPGLPGIARAEIDRRAAALHLPDFLVDAALRIPSPDGRSYRERLAAVRTERDMSAMFDDFIGMVPLGQRLFGRLNPVRTGGPMQVSIAFAEAHASRYPYPVETSIRHEVFSRRGGVWFGTAHLLGYRAPYTQTLYRFADFNAGWYASRNAAFQNAVGIAAGVPLALDGDVLQPDAAFDQPGQTERALRTLARRLDLDARDIRRALERGDSEAFERTSLYERVFELAERTARKPLPRALVPRIALHSPKITRKLSTEWFARRVDERYRRCLKRAGA
ncbi:DUF1615 domain-containing protein [Dokdonella sp.]|uniref:DUF1615 domain-containing protein n=1 Tax=Dokdonella sp. TaxID=2291710 RepID=UPI002F3FFE7D